MIVDSGGRVFVLSTDLQPPPPSAASLSKRGGKGGAEASDAFVAALRNTAQTGPLVQRLLRIVSAEVDRWGDRVVDWQHSLNAFLAAREKASAGALLSPTGHMGEEVGAAEEDVSSAALRAHGVSLKAPFIPLSLRQERDVDEEAPTSASGEAVQKRRSGGGKAAARLAFLAANQWVLLRDFLISCCDPVCRTEVMNEYRVSASSLSAAEAEGRYSVADIRSVIIYFAVASASRSLATGARAPLVGRLPERERGEEADDDAASTDAAASRLLYALSPMASLDSVLYSMLSAPSSLATHCSSGSAAAGAACPMGAAVALLQRHIIVGRGGQRAASASHFAHNHSTMAAAAALTAIFVPRPIEAALHSQGRDGRLKIVLRRKVGLWHRLLAADEAAEASKNAPSSLLTRQLGADLPPPPLRNYLCSSSRAYLEYLVSQMRFLFSPVVLASEADLLPEEGNSEEDKAAARRLPAHLRHLNSHQQNDNNNNSITNTSNVVGIGATVDADGIDVGDLFGETAVPALPPPTAAKAPATPSGLSRLLALLGGKISPQIVFSDVDGRSAGEGAAGRDTKGGASAPAAGGAAGGGPLSTLSGLQQQQKGAVYNSSTLQRRLGQLEALTASHATAGPSGAAFSSDDAASSLTPLERLRRLQKQQQQHRPHPTSLSAANAGAAHAGPSAAAADSSSSSSSSSVVYCAEIKPNGLRELRAILHDRYSINVDCYFDFMSEEGSAPPSKKEGKKDGSTAIKDSNNVDNDRGEAAVPNFKLKPGVALRPYQKASLERFCQDERKVFKSETAAAAEEEDGEATEGASGGANDASADDDAGLSEEERARRARAAEDAYNASLTGGAQSGEGNGQRLPAPTRRIAHHGIVVLPCGAGKTLTGIAASAMVGRRTIVMCINVLSVLQWRDQFLKWTCLRPEQVTVCTRDLKQIPSDVFITTYSMLTAQQPATPSGGGRRGVGGAPIETENSRLKRRIMDEISGTAWGMLVLDEVHVAPASCFQTVVDRVKYHCILGLSATLLREDMGIDKLRYLVGPKLYEANWLELTRAGNLAPVMCAEVRCPLPPSMLRQYLMHRGGYAEEARQVMALERRQAMGGKRARSVGGGSDSDGGGAPEASAGSRRMQVDIECINPYKLWCTQALVAFHESRTPPDKTIIFCDSVPAAHYYARKLGIPFMDRSARDTERSHMLKYFTHSGYLNTIILTRVGDIALDLPEATVVIQVSGLFASQRQEAQRLGRILRPKPPSLDHGTSFFYALVSDDTAEVEAAANRQAWLRDQGYTYRMLKCGEILNHYASCRGAFVANALPAFSASASASAGGALCGPIGVASPLSRPLACVGPPVWYYKAPVHVVTVRTVVTRSVFAATQHQQGPLGGGGEGLGVSRGANGKAVLRLKRRRDDEGAAEPLSAADATAAALPPPTTARTIAHATRWLWLPFSSSNSLALERSFVLGHHNRDAKMRLYTITPSGSSNANDGSLMLDHPPLMMGRAEAVVLPIVVRSVTVENVVTVPSTSAADSSANGKQNSACAAVGGGAVSSTTTSSCRWEAMGILGSCAGPATRPRHSHSSSDAERAKGWGRARKGVAAAAAASAATVDAAGSAAIDGSGGFVYFDTSDVPTSHGEWVATVREVGNDSASEGSTKSARRVGETVAAAKARLLRLLASTDPSAGAAAPTAGAEGTKGSGRKSAAATAASNCEGNSSAMVLKLRIRRGRGPVEVQPMEGDEGLGAGDDAAAMAMLRGEGGAAASPTATPPPQQEQRGGGSNAEVPLVDFEAGHSAEWNAYYALGDRSSSSSSIGGDAKSPPASFPSADEHDCCLPAGGTARTRTVAGLLATSAAALCPDAAERYSIGGGRGGSHAHDEAFTCIQHFSHTELGHRKGKHE